MEFVMPSPATADHTEAVFHDLRERMKARVDQEISHIVIFLQITAFLFAAVAVVITTDRQNSPQALVLIVSSSIFMLILMTIISFRIRRGHKDHAKLGEQVSKIADDWTKLKSADSKIKEVLGYSYDKDFGKGSGYKWSIALVVVTGLAVITVIWAVWFSSEIVSILNCIFR